MIFDPDNRVVQLCAEGIITEGTGDMARAREYYQQAWDIAGDYFERFTAAHYLARNLDDTQEELKWNDLSLLYALKIEDPGIKGALSSLYLNIGKSYEKLHDIAAATTNYQLAAEYTRHLPDDGYGKMIQGG
ncbi:MAG: rRNA adenine methyltransferase, partial [Chitinophagaceae bacterium]|nr:rRNA adenine methyltransferase [Chitinophagaceae bacterium]